MRIGGWALSRPLITGIRDGEREARAGLGVESEDRDGRCLLLWMMEERSEGRRSGFNRGGGGRRQGGRGYMDGWGG